MDIPQSRLDDPGYASFAWTRYRRLMIWMTAASFATMLLALLYLKMVLGNVPWIMAIFTGLGVFLSVMLAAALMGLVFLSAGSGHDDSVVDPLAEDVLGSEK